MYQLAIFDLDGTLLDTLAAVLSEGLATNDIDQIKQGSCTGCSQVFIVIDPRQLGGEEFTNKVADGVAVRVVGAGEGAAVAVWPRPSLEQALSAHAPCEARARARGDRLQALAGATMGPFGEIDDDHRRALAAELSVRCLKPGEVWLEDGAPAPPIALVGAGDIELYGPISEETSETVEPGALVFPDLAGTGGEASSSARAGASGALLLLADGDVAQRMAERVPDLAARLRGA